MGSSLPGVGDYTAAAVLPGSTRKCSDREEEWQMLHLSGSFPKQVLVPSSVVSSEERKTCVLFVPSSPLGGKLYIII